MEPKQSIRIEAGLSILGSLMTFLSGGPISHSKHTTNQLRVGGVRHRHMLPYKCILSFLGLGPRLTSDQEETDGKCLCSKNQATFHLQQM